MDLGNLKDTKKNNTITSLGIIRIGRYFIHEAKTEKNLEKFKQT